MVRSMVLMPLADLPQGRGRHCRVGDLDLALFRVGDAVHAIADSCPHQGASLANGALEGYWVACPAHGLKFDVRSGCSRAAAALRNQSFATRVVDGCVVLDLPAA